MSDVLASTFVSIPSGRVTLGVPACPPNANFHWRWHTGRDVDVPAFGLDAAPVTNAQYRAFLDDTSTPAPDHIDQPGLDRDDQPVVGVSWHDATRYCQWLSDRIGESCRLPRDAEWEYAARGGRAATRYPWGDALDPALAAFGGLGAPSPVRAYPANGFGLYDMIGNVWQWCEDRFEQVSDGLPAIQRAGLADDEDPRDNRVLRGGSYMTTDLLMLHIAYRHEDPPTLRHASIGFRVAVDI